MRGWSIIDIWIYIVLTGFNTNTILLVFRSKKTKGVAKISYSCLVLFISGLRQIGGFLQVLGLLHG